MFQAIFDIDYPFTLCALCRRVESLPVKELSNRNLQICFVLAHRQFEPTSMLHLVVRSDLGSQ